MIIPAVQEFPDADLQELLSLAPQKLRDQPFTIARQRIAVDRSRIISYVTFNFTKERFALDAAGRVRIGDKEIPYLKSIQSPTRYAHQEYCVKTYECTANKCQAIFFEDRTGYHLFVKETSRKGSQIKKMHFKATEEGFLPKGSSLNKKMHIITLEAFERGAEAMLKKMEIVHPWHEIHEDKIKRESFQTQTLFPVFNQYKAIYSYKNEQCDFDLLEKPDELLFFADKQRLDPYPKELLKKIISTLGKGVSLKKVIVHESHQITVSQDPHNINAVKENGYKFKLAFRGYCYEIIVNEEGEPRAEHIPG